MTLEQLRTKLESVETKIQKLKNEIYVDGYYEWVFDDVGWIAHFSYHRGLSTKKIDKTKALIRRGNQIRNNIIDRIYVLESIPELKEY